MYVYNLSGSGGRAVWKPPVLRSAGSGITAAAGTRLALQSILVKGSKFYSFQLQDMDALYCYFLSLPPSPPRAAPEVRGVLATIVRTQ